MIERFYLKEHLSFKELSLEFDKNLIIFSGPSGAGKSILMEALLAVFGLKECDAKMIEASLNMKLELEDFGILDEEINIFKCNKDKSARYFLNNQQISKKNIRQIGSQFINYLTLREFKEFENRQLLELLDAICLKKEKNYQKILDTFSKNYQAFVKNTKKLEMLEEQEKKIIDLKEFASFEIAKIEEISPKVDEYDRLLIQKKELSKKEKIESAINEAFLIFEYDGKVNEALTLLECESDFFNEPFNELRAVFENASQRLSELGDLDIEQMLDRLEKLSSLKNKHGTIENSLLYLEEKKKELESYENIEFEKSELIKDVEELKVKVDENALILSKKREIALKTLSQKTEHYLNLLYLENITFNINKVELHSLGYDSISVTLRDTELSKVSSGELNRIRLAQLASASEFIHQNGGVLILDEIDANLSGKESMSIAKVLELLAKTYQIFAISHQPQLSSKAQMHFLVYKEDGESRVKILKKDEERVAELSRMISGDKVSLEACEFAKSLLKQNIS